MHIDTLYSHSILEIGSQTIINIELCCIHLYSIHTVHICRQVKHIILSYQCIHNISHVCTVHICRMTCRGMNLYLEFKKVSGNPQVCLSRVLFKALTSYISLFGQKQVSDVILRAKKWRKKALATKEIGKDPEVLLYIRNTEISCVYLQYILSIYIVLYASHAQMTTEEVRPDARARRRAMIEVRVAASQLLAPWSPVTVNLCDAHAFVYIHTMCRQSPCSATHAHANEYTQYIIHICHAIPLLCMFLPHLFIC